MSAPVDDDAVLETLKGLPPCDVPALRADEIRQRCQAVMARRARQRRSAERAVARAWEVLAEPALVAGLSAVFLVEVVRRAMRLY